MSNEILHWPWRLDGSRDWCQGLWRAQAGERVIEFFGTKPCAEWPVAEAQLLHQLERAIAANNVVVVSGPPLPQQLAMPVTVPRGSPTLRPRVRPRPPEDPTEQLTLL